MAAIDEGDGWAGASRKGSVLAIRAGHYIYKEGK